VSAVVNFFCKRLSRVTYDYYLNFGEINMNILSTFVIRLSPTLSILDVAGVIFTAVLPNLR